MLIFQVDGNMVIKNLQNQYYHAQVFLLCIMYAQFIGGEKWKHKFTSVLRKASTLICQNQWENWFHLWVLWKKLQVYLDYWQDIQYFVALSGKIIKSVSLLQRSQSLLQGHIILPSSIISFDVLLVMEKLSLTQLIPPNRLQIFSQIPLEKRFSTTYRISLWGGNLFLEIHSSFTITTVSGGVWGYQNGN